MPFFKKLNFEEELNNINITKEIVLKKLKKIKVNKSPGPDKLHPRVLREVSASIAEPLADIFATSIQTRQLPDEWKHAHVSVIFKKGKQNKKKPLPNSYKPVSLTCISCKLLESIIREHIIDHMSKNNSFSPRQFGFISGRSTTLQLLHVLQIWSEFLDQGGNLDIIYCDFMKAFDKVPHRRLLHEIKGCGIKGNILGWIDSFLSNRTQCVIINNTKSTSAPVTSRIPQGSVLGPILFVLYINDLLDVVDKKTAMYFYLLMILKSSEK